MKEEESIGIKIHEIKELSFSNKLIDEIIEDFKNERVKLNLGFGVKTDFEKNTISINIVTDFFYNSNDKSNSKEFLSLETSTKFKVKNYNEDDIKLINEDEVFIDDDLMYVFLSTAIGATRGMLAYKTASLPINVVLPLFDMDNLIKQKESDVEE